MATGGGGGGGPSQAAPPKPLLRPSELSFETLVVVSGVWVAKGARPGGRWLLCRPPGRSAAAFPPPARRSFRLVSPLSCPAVLELPAHQGDDQPRQVGAALHRQQHPARQRRRWVGAERERARAPRPIQPRRRCIPPACSVPPPQPPALSSRPPSPPRPAAYSVFRLFLPELDRRGDRDNYRLLEAKLAGCLIKAAGLDRNAPGEPACAAAARYCQTRPAGSVAQRQPRLAALEPPRAPAAASPADASQLALHCTRLPLTAEAQRARNWKGTANSKKAGVFAEVMRVRTGVEGGEGAGSRHAARATPPLPCSTLCSPPPTQQDNILDTYCGIPSGAPKEARKALKASAGAGGWGGGGRWRRAPAL